MLGCDRVFHINDRFGDGELLAKQLGLVRIFDQSTVNRFLRTFKKWHVTQLERILLVLIQQHGKFQASVSCAGRRCVGLDPVDAQEPRCQAWS